MGAKETASVKALSLERAGLVRGTSGGTVAHVNWTTACELGEVAEDGPGCAEPVGSREGLGFHCGWNERLLGS